MKLISGKRQFREECLFGFVLYTSFKLGLRSLLFVVGQRGWGVQWIMKKRA